MAKKDSLANFMEQGSGDFIGAVKRRFVDKHADTALKILEEFEQIEKAHKRYQGWVNRLEKGDLTAIAEYLKARQKLEDVEGYDLD